jgi:hypothetical protein
VRLGCHESFPFSMDGLYIKDFLREQDLFVRLDFLFFESFGVKLKVVN